MGIIELTCPLDLVQHIELAFDQKQILAELGCLNVFLPVIELWKLVFWNLIPLMQLRI